MSIVVYSDINGSGCSVNYYDSSVEDCINGLNGVDKYCVEYYYPNFCRKNNNKCSYNCEELVEKIKDCDLFIVVLNRVEYEHEALAMYHLGIANTTKNSNQICVLVAEECSRYLKKMLPNDTIIEYDIFHVDVYCFSFDNDNLKMLEKFLEKDLEKNDK
jgi:hypothetical protein